MSLKIGKTMRKRKPWSLASRLAWVYSISAFLMLALATFSLYWILANSLESENFKFLQYKAFIWQKILQNQPNYLQSNLTETIFFEDTIYDYYTRVINDRGEILFETPGMKINIPMDAYHAMLTKNPEVFPSKRYRSPFNHKLYLLMTSFVPTDLSNHYLFIEVAKDISTERELIVDYRRGILIILLVGIAASAGIGFWVTRHGLKPLGQITATTQHISISQINERLDPASWPKELSKLATAFNSMLDRIEQGLTQLKQFSGDLAHELRTPINNLMSATEVTLRKARTTTEYHEVLESIFEEFERIAQMIESLLFLAQTESPTSHLNKKTFTAKKLMQDLQDFYEGLVEEKEITMTLAGDVNITADEFMIRRVLSNLISNALKHTPRGGNIMLNAFEDEEHRPNLTIKDTGFGIPPEHLPFLFNRFYRVDTARAKKTGGTGLGLSIVKSIMDWHHGEVKIMSQPGKGTQVTLVFPRPLTL